MPLPCRLEEQTKRLQKDMKKSTDADLGRRPVPVPGLDGGGAEVGALLAQSLLAQKEVPLVGAPQMSLRSGLRSPFA